MSDSLPTNFDFALLLTDTPEGLRVDALSRYEDGKEPANSEAKAVLTWLGQNWPRIKAEVVAGIKAPYRTQFLGADGKPIH